MPSKFPGMDPFLEGQVWEDFHHRLITAVADDLGPRLKPRYVARIQERIYLEREEFPQLIIPDVSIMAQSPVASLPSRGAMGAADAPVRVRVLMPERVREAYIDVRLRETDELVTCIEILSPANKRANSVGRSEYLSKRRDILWRDVHLVEIDLLRGGERLPMAEPLPAGDYYVVLHRVEDRPEAEVWSRTIRGPLPKFPVPLLPDDRDICVDLQQLFSTIYDRAGYDYSLNYCHGTTPALKQDEASWVEALLLEG